MLPSPWRHVIKLCKLSKAANCDTSVSTSIPQLPSKVFLTKLQLHYQHFIHQMINILQIVTIISNSGIVK